MAGLLFGFQYGATLVPAKVCEPVTRMTGKTSLPKLDPVCRSVAQ